MSDPRMLYVDLSAATMQAGDTDYGLIKDAAIVTNATTDRSN